MTRYVGLIGYPLGHSVSPPMQQAAFDHYRLDLRYEVWETEPAQFDALAERLRHRSTLGANVTVPYKETVLPLLDSLDELARQIGAVNTVVNKEGKLSGYNTDAEGFLRALRQEGGFEPRGKRVVLLGAGGVAKAAGFALARAGVKSLAITDIVGERAQGLTSSLRQLGVEVNVLDGEEESLEAALSNCDLVVNCTPVGMKHSPSESQSPLEAKLIPKGALIYDVVYNPIETPLLLAAKSVGARTLGGLAMLVYQGAAAFELWTGKKAPIDIMFAAAKGALMERETRLPEWLEAIYELAKGVGVRTGLNTEVKVTKTGRLSFYASGMNFAFGNCRESLAIIIISTNAEWARRARVAHLADGIRKNGWWGRDDSAYWRIGVSDKKKLQEVESILAKVCQARLQ